MGTQALQILHKDEDPGWQGRGQSSLLSVARDATLAQPLSERAALEERPQGEAEGEHEPDAAREPQSVQVAVSLWLAVAVVVMRQKADDVVGN